MKNLNLFDENPELNITPLVDVMLVLLVVLMLIVPALRYDEAINLPDGSKQHASAASKENLIISVNNEKISYDNKSYSRAEFFDNFILDAGSMNKERVVFIAGDKQISYELLMRVLATLKQLGFSKISLQSK